MDTDISSDMFQKPQYLQNFLLQNHFSKLDYYWENRPILNVYILTLTPSPFKPDMKIQVDSTAMLID